MDYEERHFESSLLSKKLKERNPVNILSREDLDFANQDANSHQRQSWQLESSLTFAFTFKYSIASEAFFALACEWAYSGPP